MIDERFASAVSAWLRRTDSPSRHAEDNVGHAMAQIRDRRRRRRLWFLPGPKPTAGADDQTTRAVPIPTIVSTGGIRTMFSATKLVGIAAAVALFGALMLAVPFGSQDTQAPAAPATDPDPGRITMYAGSLHVVSQDEHGTQERYDWGHARSGEQWTNGIKMSDPRLSGTATCYTNVYETNTPGRGWLRTYNCRLFSQEDQGTWQETGRGYMDPESSSIHYQSRLVGEGAYEGLFALQRCDAPAFGPGFECEGAIFEGGLPPTPDSPPDALPEAGDTP